MATPTFIHPGPVFVQSNASANRYITSGELSAEAGLGTVTSIKSGSNITFQPSTITVTGSIGLNPNPVLDSLTVSGTGLFYAPIYQGSVTGANRVMVSGELAASEGMTSLVAGSNIVLAPTTITTTGTVGLNPDPLVSSITVSGLTTIYNQTKIIGSGINLVVQGVAGNVKDLTQWRDSTGAAIGKVTSAGAILTSNGSLSAPSISFINSTNSGLYWDGTNLNIASTGARSLVINASYWNSEYNGTFIISHGSSGGPIAFQQFTGTANLQPLKIGWIAGDTNTGRVEINGMLGIGTTTPGNKLDVAGSVTVSGTSLFYDTVTANAGVIHPYQILDTVVDLAGLGNSFTASGAIPVGLCLGTLIHVQQTIVGCSGLNAGSAGTPTLWAALAYSSLASGTKTTDADILATSISRYTSLDHVVLQASGGVFTSGKVNIRTCYVALS